MNLSARFDYSKVRFDQDNDMVLLTGLKAPSVNSDDRQPLNLVAVLDISGSMMGDKIERMKKTTQILIDHLTEQDKLGIVIFSTNFTKLASCETMTSARKEELKNRVSTLQATMQTNISGAMLMGFEILNIGDNTTNRVLLLTDGLPNVGEASHPGLVQLVGNRPDRTSLTTFGFGTDHNPELLQSMASAGGGNYYYIKNADQINTAFAQELGGLVSCFAQNIKIEVKFKPGVKDVDLLNDAWEWEYDEEKLTVRLPDLFAEETKNILAKVSIEKRTSALPREVTIADVKVSFTNLTTKKSEVIEDKVKLEFVKQGEESKERDAEIVKIEAKLQAVKAQKQAVEMATAGNFVGAQQLMGNTVCSLQDAGENDYAGDLQSWSSNLNSRCYSSDVAYSGLRTSYAVSRGRSAGQVGGQSVGATRRQKSMMKSFTKTSKTSSVPSQTSTKKTKKKKHNPMTD
jgi:hypothetical protein